LIGNDRPRATFVATFALTLGVLAGVLGFPAAATAREPAVPVASSTPLDPGLTVTITVGSNEATYVTHAKTVADFLTERGIAVSPQDSVSPSPDTALADGTHVDYRAAVPVHLIVGGRQRDISSAAPDVATLLASEHVSVAPSDSVEPKPTDPIESGMVVRVTREKTWTALRRQLLHASVVNRYDPKLPTGTTKTLFAGRTGERVTMVHFVQRDDRPIQTRSIVSRIVRRARARIVVHGIGEYVAFA
jgi:uncharacterized protein YabE (DUF348 family)